MMTTPNTSWWRFTMEDGRVTKVTFKEKSVFPEYRGVVRRPTPRGDLSYRVNAIDEFDAYVLAMRWLKGQGESNG